MSGAAELDLPAWRRPIRALRAEDRPPGAPALGTPALPRIDQIAFNQQINLTQQIRVSIQQRDKTGTPLIPDEAVVVLYDILRNELLRRGKKV